ncbi:MAG: helix-turn-helix transcriptional regulator [Anaerolineales bacterium]|nr:helix-turn-helix transcriptional regulator [Anaerolineales bacterium]
MPNDDFAPVTQMVLTEDKKIRAYAHPVRMNILEQLGREKHSISGIARALGVHPANITHHFKLLEQAGLIRLVEKRDTGKNLEKFYRAAAYHFSVNLAGEPLAGKKTLALSILHDSLTAALQAVKGQGDEAAVFGLLKNLRLAPGDVPKFQARLMKLVEEYEKRRPKDGAAYTVNISFYPGEPVAGEGGELFIREEGTKP